MRRRPGRSRRRRPRRHDEWAAAVKRRDGGRCTFRRLGLIRCPARSCLEAHHRVPWGACGRLEEALCPVLGARIARAIADRIRYSVVLGRTLCRLHHARRDPFRRGVSGRTIRASRRTEAGMLWGWIRLFVIAGTGVAYLAGEPTVAAVILLVWIALEAVRISRRRRQEAPSTAPLVDRVQDLTAALAAEQAENDQLRRIVGALVIEAGGEVRIPAEWAGQDVDVDTYPQPDGSVLIVATQWDALPR